MAIVSLSDAIASKSGTIDSAPKIDIVTFAEHPSFLNIRLYPVQRFILKLMFGIKLSDNLENPIIIRDKFNEIVEYEFYSEIDFLAFLYKEDMINSMEFENVSNIFLICGRRASKTTITSIISTYTLYNILNNSCPQDYYGILRASEISVSICSNNKTNANKNMREIQTLVDNAPFFKPYVTKNAISHSGNSNSGAGLTFRTKHEIQTGQKVGDIIVTTFAANPSVRGSNNMVSIMDEYAHFNDSELSTKEKPLDKTLWEALTPSTSGFLHPNGIKAGKNIALTSPNGKKGEVWNKKSSSKGSKTTLYINLPSWWMNPRISSEDLKDAFKDSEASYWQEYGAKFVSKTGSAIGNLDKFYAQFDMKIPNTVVNTRRNAKYFVGIDQAFSGDAFSIAVCHFEPKYIRQTMDEKYDRLVSNEDVIVFDYIGRMQADGGEPLQVEDVLSWIETVVRTFPVFQGAYDNWSAELFGYALSKKGIGKNLGELTATQQSNDKIARAFKRSLADGKLAFPYSEEFIEECLLLTEKLASKFIKIENTSGHDDQYSAMSKALYFCYLHHVLKDKDGLKIKDNKQTSHGTAARINMHNKNVLSQTSKFNGVRIS